MLKKIIYLLLTTLVLINICSCDSDPKLYMDIKGYGTIVYQLDRTNAPITVDYFCDLADKGLLDHTYFIRMQSGFVLQGGAGSTSTATVKGEFSANGVNNNLSHDVGVISMARSTEADSATTQFFIVLSEDAKESLDGQYAAFGKIIEGYDIVEKICNDITMEDYYDDYYYGYYMGFLKESSYIEITKVYTKNRK